MNTIFVRYGIWAALIGAVVAILVELVEIMDAALAITSVPFVILRAISFLLLALGVWRLHMLQSQQGGKLSLIGALLMVIGYLFMAALVLSLIGGEISDFEGPIGEIAADNPLIIIVFPLAILGPLLFGIASVRAKFYPRWTGIILAISPFLVFVVFAGAPTIISNIYEMLGPLVLGVMAWPMRDNS